MKATINIPKQKSKKSKKQSRNSNVAIVAQEIKFARLLAGNEKRQRDRVLATLKKWLSTCFKNKYDFKEDDFTRVWKGLFYAMWMSDKPLIQEELCENISGILDEFPSERVSSAALMMGAGLKVLAKSWFGIDQHRIDKFLMFVRRLLRAWFRCLKRADWSQHSCEINTNMLSGTEALGTVLSVPGYPMEDHKSLLCYLMVFVRLYLTSGQFCSGILAPEIPRYARNALSLQLHITECYLEELAKVSQGEIFDLSIVELTRPFAIYMSKGGEMRLISCIRKNIFKYLIRQSDLGIEYEERRRAWSQMGCPPGGPDALVLDVGDDDGSDDEGLPQEDSPSPLDPRAGRVDVTLSSLPVPVCALVCMLTELQKTASGTAHCRLKECRSWFEQLSQDLYPFRVAVGTDKTRELSEPAKLPSKRRAALQMQAFEDGLVADSDELAVRGLSKKQKKRALAQRRAALLSGDTAGPDATTSGNWTVEQARTDPEQVVKEPTTKRKHNKENVSQKNVKKQKKGEKLAKTEVSKTTDREKKQNGDSVKTERPLKHEQDKKNVIVIKEKAKNYQKQTLSPPNKNVIVDTFNTRKRVKFALKNNSMQATVDYYESLLSSPNIPFDASKKPTKTNLKPNSTPSPINPFFKKKLNLKRPPFNLP